MQWFPPEQLPLLADLFARLNPLLGPLRGMQQGGVPEPDGLGDLHRRGPYERLLASEWLLADELPDEFLRRAVVGEHLFLAPQYRTHQANRMIVVLFDAGPLQLGGPRLVHLALLILLARRASEAGAELRWGSLQNAPQLHEFKDAAHLKQLLDARTYQTVTDEHWHTWRAWLSEQNYDSGERWLVGQQLPATNARSCTHRVQIQRSLDGSSLMVALQDAGTRQVALPNPDERLALQLIKGEFDIARQITRTAVKTLIPRVALTLPPVIAGSGSHVALKLLDEPGLVVIKLPAPRQKKPFDVRRTLWNNRSTPLAITFPGRMPGAILSLDEQLVFWNMPGVKPVARPERERLQMPVGTATLLPMVWMHNGTYGRVFLLDTKGHLAFWVVENGKLPTQHQSGVTHSMADKVVGMAQVDRNILAYLRHDAGRLYVHRINPWISQSKGHVVGTSKGVNVEQVLFPASACWDRAFHGCAWMRLVDGQQQWQMVAPDLQTEQIDLAPGWKGLGLLIGEDEVLSMVLLSPNQQTVALYFQGEQRVLFTTNETIARISFCPMSGLVAALTKARELVVYSARDERRVLQVMCNQAQTQSEDAPHVRT
ncbi:hypothetical protein LN426_07100 [Pseudomonas syringae]|uniref:hypothetical protein n=1 Tax=Pseudomonas syringae TaxID=317 RepID=UPI001E4328DD|nr:hypothetical protein [Pseudomonas syringae]MDC6490630.1 hypothetical protein [Pseudomonas syringae]MDC6494435.1 hypothetical protein [Pseudomonas syringae]MDC6511012.1 hypothetical protein [Pseudomonas syringae]MDC6524837.1 hypothetical protein [Pseudomonas syringae]MDC6531889.1 hypothetical protein [Pseudomonas syringae]